jgi:branched-chain amino acid transport system permease protein
VGCALAAAAGGLIGPIFSISPFIGMVPVMKAFVVIILGGLGSIPGAVLGGIILGITESLSATFAGAIFQDMIGFFIILLILILKPSGLLGYE